MTTTALLIAAAFFSSTLTAVAGVGGGMLLISILAIALPPAAIVPVHGVAQLASNASRMLLTLNSTCWAILRPFGIGCLLGALLGSRLWARFPVDFLPIPLGLFILMMTWMPTLPHSPRLPGRFFLLGLVQAILTLFAGATGPLNMPVLMREGLSKDEIIGTGSVMMTAVHLIKIVTFGLLGFAFGTYWLLITGMVVAVVVGSWAGTRLRELVSETLFRLICKLLITALAFRMILATLMTT